VKYLAYTLPIPRCSHKREHAVFKCVVGVRLNVSPVVCSCLKHFWMYRVQNVTCGTTLTELENTDIMYLEKKCT